MALTPTEAVCLNYEILAEAYRSSGEAYCYKVGRSLGQSSCFPCQKNEENGLSKGCYVSSRNDPENLSVTIKEDDFALADKDIDVLTKVDNWTFLRKENSFLVFEKKQRNFDMDEWCFYLCTHPIRFAYLSPSQLRKYEFLRGEKITGDVKAFIDIDKSYLEYLKAEKEKHPKIAIAIALETAQRV